MLSLRAAVKIRGAHFGPVVAPGNQPLPVIPAHLILQIQPHLIEILLFVGSRAEGAFIDVDAVNRVRPVQVVLRSHPAFQQLLIFRRFVIQAAEQGVIDIARRKQGFELVINAKLIGGALFVLGATGQHRTVRRAVRVHQIAIFLLDGRVTRVLAEGEVIGKLVLQLVADHGLLAPRLVVIRIADVKVARNIAAIRAGHRAVRWQEVAITGVGIFLIAGQQGKTRLIVRIPGDRRGNRHARFFIIFHLIVLGAGDTVYAIQHAAVIAQRPAKIKRAFRQIVIPGAELHVVNRLAGGAFAGHADQTAWVDLTK
ncbi:hypothetical protein D3C80_1040450 [compost metagenome]